MPGIGGELGPAQALLRIREDDLRVQGRPVAGRAVLGLADDGSGVSELLGEDVLAGSLWAGGPGHAAAAASERDGW